jgi:hypothetical protein
MQTVIRLVKAGPANARPAPEGQASKTACHLDSILISGITLSKFPGKKGGKVNIYRYSCGVSTNKADK